MRVAGILLLSTSSTVSLVLWVLDFCLNIIYCQPPQVFELTVLRRRFCRGSMSMALWRQAIDIEPFLISYGVNLILEPSQKLLRTKVTTDLHLTYSNQRAIGPESLT